MKKTLLAAALVAASATAMADTQFYGWAAYTARDIDSNEDLDYTGNGFSQSRFGVKFGQKVTDEIKAVGRIEIGIRSGEETDGDTSQLISRVHEFGFSGSFGKVTMGQGFDVGDGVINADLAGTNLVDPLSSNSTGAVGFGVNGFDPGRGEALRYFTPKLGGVATIGIQLQEDGETEIALRADYQGFRFNAFAEQRDPEDDKTGVLIGYGMAGFSLTYVQSEDKQADIEHSGFKLGYKTGKHKASVSMVERDEGNEATSLAYMYTPVKGVELYAQWKEMETNSGADVDDGVAFGGRVKF